MVSAPNAPIRRLMILTIGDSPGEVSIAADEKSGEAPRAIVKPQARPSDVGD